MAIGGFEMELLMSKMDYLQDKLQEVEQTMKSTIEKVESKLESRINAVENSLQKAMKIELQKVEQASKARHVNLQNKLTKLEKDVMQVNFKIETAVQAMEDSLKQSANTSEDNTRAKLEVLKNQLISKIENMQLQQMAETKTYQETALSKINKLYPLIKLVTLRSCRQAAKNDSDKYIIKPGINTQPFEVLCEQNNFDGGWTVIQHRFDGSVDFFRNWTEYRNGFGSLDGEFWLGLEYVHQLTKNRPHELLVEIKDFHGSYGYAKYDKFEIGSEAEKYMLKKLGKYSGTAGHSLVDNKYEMFSTFDRDNDKRSDNCAEIRQGAWWYFRCTYSNLNGRYQNTSNDQSAMTWYHFKNDYRGMSYSRIMIRDIN
ncbi:AGAP011225-PA-like protein [Anopheles sinensis]|uniref:AGAP011225-PA-like protein n=1 Tax=Anopheles sinensis TaxID=74873 RepID=A0A084VKL8_ANOSI|nr:AGAP011225-PA-like protein [Anopheles sinensis]